MPRKTITLTCNTCGAVHEREAAHARRYKKHYCSVECRQAQHKGATHPQWQGGILHHPSGYIRRTAPDGSGTDWEHRWVWEQAIGPIPDGYEIHHRNEDRADNRIENLELILASDHRRKHAQVDRWAKRHDCCRECGSTSNPHEGNGLCIRCYDKHRRLHANSATRRQGS